MTTPSETGALGIFWTMRLDRPLPGGPTPRVPATIRRAGPEDVEELALAMGFDDPDPVLQRLGLGKHCYVARVEGRLVAYGWITFDTEEIGELGLHVRLREGEAYIWDCATLAAYRGQRLYPALLTCMLAELQRAGLRRVWIGTDADNLPSQSGVAIAGCQPVVDIIQAQDGGYATRGRTGVSPQEVLDAHYALFGNRDTSRVLPFRPADT